VRFERGELMVVCSSLVKASDKTPKTTLESLFHSSIRPDHYWNHVAVGSGFVKNCLAQLHPTFFICDAFSIPLSEQSDTRIAPADGVHNGKLLVHTPRLSAVRQLEGSRQEHAHLFD
jgi:hypothetical protein